MRKEEMLNSLKMIFLIGLVFLFTLNAFAMTNDAIAANPTESLQKILRDEIRKCPALDCAGLRVQLSAMNAADFVAMPRESRSMIRNKMLELAHDIWPDTIHEGPYYSKFNIRLERQDIQMLTVDGQWVGFRVGYSDKAWDMDHCDPMTEPESKQDLNNCRSGRIYDRGFITKDFGIAFRDESTDTHFEVVAE